MELLKPQDVKLTEVSLPDFGLPKEMQKLTILHYGQRVEMLRERMKENGYTHFLVYGDREHSANIEFLSGLDPRFEEALLVVGLNGMPKVLVGNEDLGYLGDSPAEVEPVLFQDFSLVGQPRSDSDSLETIFTNCGIKDGSKVAIAGWKYFDYDDIIESPAFIVDTLRDLVGLEGEVSNGGYILMNPDDGLRCINNADQLAVFEFGATHCTQSLRNMHENVKQGMTEIEAAQKYKLNAMPLCCHPMLTAGPRARMGLPSPSDRVIEKGDMFTSALGYWGSLSARAGWFVENESELPENAKNYLDDLAKPYFALVANYYQMLSVGTSCGEIYAMTQEYLKDKKFKLALNPGHLIHNDEWVSTPFYEGSEIEIKSGMAIQIDMIPVANDPNLFTINIEDGVAIADAELRDEIEDYHPDMWQRIQKRRDFYINTLKIDLPEDVLPMSNLAARLCPFIMNQKMAFTF